MPIRSLSTYQRIFLGLGVGALVLIACGDQDQRTAVEEQSSTTAASSGEPSAVPTTSQTEQDPAQDDAPGLASDGDVITEFSLEVVASYPHDVDAFTQGLELDDDGSLLESTGLFGESDLRKVDLETGDVEQVVATPLDYFAEGITKVGDEIVQITWQNNTAFYWDAATYELNRQVNYEGEGWGICFDGRRLIMTDGSSELIFRDPVTFDEVGRMPVTSQGVMVDALNEIECVQGTVWANRWTSDQIVGIDPTTGRVVATVDASSIRYDSDDANEVLNGIAWDEATDTFLLTGKRWPTIYRVTFVPAAEG